MTYGYMRNYEDRVRRASIRQTRAAAMRYGRRNGTEHPGWLTGRRQASDGTSGRRRRA